MPYSPEEYYEKSYAELGRRAGMRRKGQERRALESLAAHGALYGGARQARMREIEQDVSDFWQQGAQAIEAQRFAAEEAARQRQWQTGERVGSEQFQLTKQEREHAQQAAMQKYGLDFQRWSQLSAQEQERLIQEAAHGYKMEQMGAQFGYQQQLQTQAEEAQRALASDKAAYAERLQQLVQAGQMDLQTAQNAYNQYAMQADQQFQYAQMLAQQQYGYGMQNLQGQWGTYQDILGYQHQAGMAGMEQAYNWQALMAQQGFQAGMAQLGWNYDVAKMRWQSREAQLDRQGQYHLQHLANDAGSWLDSLLGGFGSMFDINWNIG